MGLFRRLEPEPGRWHSMTPLSSTTPQQSRLRLIVIQALVFSLFATLFARLCYLQVVTGEEYQAQAAAQSVRDIVVQPQRGLIVDAMGRPLVANRMSWVVSVDRTVLGKLAERQQRTRCSSGSPTPSAAARARSRRSWSPAATRAACRAMCWNGSPYQPVPVAEDVDRAGRAADPRAARGLPRRARPSSRPCAPTRSRSASTPPTCSATSARSPRTSSTAAEDGRRPLGQRRVVGRPGRRREGVRRVAARHARLPQRRGRLDGPGARRRRARSPASPATPWSPRSTRKVQGVVEKQLAQTITTARATRRPGDRPQLRRRLRRRRRDGGRHRPDRRDGQPADVRPRRSGSAASPRSSSRGSTPRQAGTPLLGRATQGQFAPGSTWKPFMTAGALTHGYTHRHPAQLLLGVPGRQPGVQELRVRRLRLHRLRQGARGLLQHVLLPGRLRLLAAVRLRRRRRQRQATRWSRRPRRSASAARPASTCRARPPAGSPTGKWKRAYWKPKKDYYCGIADKPQDGETSDFVYLFAREFCIEGYAYRAGDAVNFAIGQGDTIVTPLQLARAYAALANGGTLSQPRVGKAIVAPDGTVVQRIAPEGGRQGRRARQRACGYIDTALKGVTRQRHDGLADGRLPARRGADPLQDRLGRGLRQAVDVVGRVVHRGLRRGDDGQPGRHRLRARPGPAVRKIWEALYGIDGEGRRPGRRRDPRHHAAARACPRSADDGSILPPARRRPTDVEPARPTGAGLRARLAAAGRGRCCCCVLGSAAGLVGHHAPATT